MDAAPASSAHPQGTAAAGRGPRFAGLSGMAPRRSGLRAGARGWRARLASAAEKASSAGKSGAVPGPPPSSAGKAAAEGAKGAGGFAGWVKSGWEKHGQALAKNVSEGVAKTASAVKESPPFKGMEMKVNVDVLKPTIDGMRTGVTEAWRQLPPPVQQAAPYLACAALTAAAVHALEVRVRRRQELKFLEQIDAMNDEKKELRSRINRLEIYGEREVGLSRAIAEATAAAASAATAAAQASQACVVRPRPA